MSLSARREAEYAYYTRLYRNHGYARRSSRLLVTNQVVRDHGLPGRWLDAGCGEHRIDVGDGVDLVRCDPSAPSADHSLAIHELGEAFDPETFDVVSSFDVLEHLLPEELAECVLHLWTLVKPGGRMITSVGTKEGGVWAGRTAHLTVEPAAWWKALLEDLLGVEARQVACAKGVSPFFVTDKPCQSR